MSLCLNLRASEVQYNCSRKQMEEKESKLFIKVGYLKQSLLTSSINEQARVIAPTAKATLIHHQCYILMIVITAIAVSLLR